VASQLDPGHARHLDVEQHDLGLRDLDLRERLGRVGRLADDPVREFGGQVGQQLAKPRAGDRFVVNDQDRRCV